MCYNYLARNKTFPEYLMIIKLSYNKTHRVMGIQIQNFYMKSDTK